MFVVPFCQTTDPNLCYMHSEAYSPSDLAKSQRLTFDYVSLAKVVKHAIRNLNRVIDVNMYPVESARKSNFKHRPIGLGVQGLSDVFTNLGFPFESAEADRINREIFEVIYYAALEASCELAEKFGPYETFKTSYVGAPDQNGSPVSRGILQHDMWTPNGKAGDGKIYELVQGLDWSGLRAKIATVGVRNSLLIALMPTASTADILNNTPGCDPLLTFAYKRKNKAGEFNVVNAKLIEVLSAHGLWTKEMCDAIVAQQGTTLICLLVCWVVGLKSFANRIDSKHPWHS